MRALFSFGLIGALAVACASGRERSTVTTVSAGSGAPTSGAGAQGGGGSGGDEANASSSATGGASASSASSVAASSSSSSSASSSGSGMFICPQGALICDGNIAKICDGNGGFSMATDCAGGVCAPNLGCKTCTPGKAQCSGDTSILCSDDGTSQTTSFCDPLQGLSCSPMTGLCVGSCTPENLGQSYFGCDYFPTITNNQLLTNKVAEFAVAISNTTAFNVTATVTKGASTIKTAMLAPNSVQIVTMPWIPALDQQTTQMVVDGAYRLRTTRPVTVYQYNPLQYKTNSFSGFTYTNDASLLLPVNAWTGNYRVVARNHWAPSFSDYGGLYAVTAAEDGTQVTVTPSPTGGKVLAGAGIGSNGAGVVTLNSGDVLQVFTARGGGSPDTSDLTGTLITATKPVQVIGGHMCTNVPYNVPYCDHIEESMPPLETLATGYIVTAPLINPSSIKVRMVRVVATVDGTTLTYDPPQGGAPTQLGVAGSYIEIPLTAADFSIKASKPVLVAEYFTGQDQGGGSGDPAMTLAVATAQYRTSYLFHAPTNYDSNYVNIVAPTNATVTLDGMAVSNLKPIGGSGYGVARIQLSNAGDGNHNISANLPFGISVYGYGQYTSYWYPGGLNLTPLGL
ncbi:MAG: IgGFc-binding protein [Deltaproteobacteria bacterium]|nr:IgGFc-binding protein [Deltaproteobacteria bacterium]